MHLKKDPAHSEPFKGALAAQLEALALDPPRPVRLWVMDEMRCGLHTETRRVWALRGLRPTVAVPQKYEWPYVYGALEVGRSGAQFLYAETVSLKWSRAFQRADRRARPREPAGGDSTMAPAAITGTARPTCRPMCGCSRCRPIVPELNPVEKLWDIVRDGLCNRIFVTLEELPAALTAVLQRYGQDARAVFSLIGKGWLLREANASGSNVLPV